MHIIYICIYIQNKHILRVYISAYKELHHYSGYKHREFGIFQILFKPSSIFQCFD